MRSAGNFTLGKEDKLFERSRTQSTSSIKKRRLTKHKEKITSLSLSITILRLDPTIAKRGMAFAHFSKFNFSNTFIALPKTYQ